MSLYVFNIQEDSAIVSADTRLCTKVGNKLYQLNDNAQKLFAVDDMIITLGGTQWIGLHIINTFKELSGTKSPHGLHQVVHETLHLSPELAVTYGVPAPDISTPFFLEICCLQYNGVEGCNVFYHICQENNYALESYRIDSSNAPVMIYGGIDQAIVRDYLKYHRDGEYLTNLKNAYEIATSEKIGGRLMIAEQRMGNVSISEVALRDKRKITHYVG